MEIVRGLVSITIPFHNNARFIEETIESVFAQTYTEWELLLVDDGSTDQSAEIAHTYASRVPAKIQCLAHENSANLGVTRTRNLGAARSRGEYLAFLDADDKWLPNKLATQVSAMEKHPEAGLVYGPSEYWFDWEPVANHGEINHVEPLVSGQKLYFPPELLARTHPIGPVGAPCPSSFLLRRSAFASVGGFVEAFNPRTFQLYEDTAFLTKIYLHVPVYVLNTCSDRYRCDPGSIWHRTRGTRHEEDERRYFFRWLRKYLEQCAVTDTELVRAIRKKAWPYWLPLPSSATLALRRIANRYSK